jgi:hypothetical protein
VKAYGSSEDGNMVIDANTIYKSEHDLIAETYDWLTDSNNNEVAKCQYILGVHDMALMLLDKLGEIKKE